MSNFFHQPSLERELHALVTRTGAVTVRRGQHVTGCVEDDEGVEVESAGEDGAVARARARFVVGADGAHSVVRGWIGEEFADLGYFRDWLVVDLLPHTPIAPTPPALQLCDPRRPTTLVPAGPGRRRWEFMRLPHEDPAEFASVENAWRLLEPWGVGPDQAVLERHALYTFQARRAERWRRDRLLIADDSAHLMPPFAGQGMCSGLRDAVNLEWKLDLVLGGADPRLLDTYGPERAAHVQDFIAFSMELGAVICISDPDEARARDRQLGADLAAGIVPPPRPLPRLGPGLHRGGDDPLAGSLSVQAVVVGEHGPGLFDDVTGSPAALIGSAAALADLDGNRSAALAAVGVHVVALADEPGPGAVVDVDGTYTAWLAGHGTRAVLVRPDCYVYGCTAADEPVSTLVDTFLAELG